MSNVYIRIRHNDETISRTGGWDVRERYFEMKNEILTNGTESYGVLGNSTDVYLVELVRRRKNKTKLILDFIEFQASGKILRSSNN